MTEQFRNYFNAKIAELNEEKDSSSSYITKDRFAWIIHRLGELKEGDVKKEAKDYRLLKSYDVITRSIQDTVVHQLIKPGSNLVYVTHEDMFDSIHEIHLSAGHGTRDIMYEKTKKRYANITKELLQLNTNLCEDCQLKKKEGQEIFCCKAANLKCVK